MWWMAAAYAVPPAAELRADWEKWRPQLDSLAKYPLSFSDEEWQRVASGEVARRREHVEGTDRVVGLRWIDADQDTVWLALHDPHGAAVKGFVVEDLPGSTPERRIEYQRLTLPWPLSDRQWVIEVRNNLDLMTATGGAVWERTWTLSDQRGAKAEEPDAVWLTVDDGGWFEVAAGGGTLLGYHVRSVIGGVVPDEAAVQWSYATLSSLLNGVADRVPWVKGHYVGAHEPVPRPGGAPIPTFAVH